MGLVLDCTIQKASRTWISSEAPTIVVRSLNTGPSNQWWMHVQTQGFLSSQEGLNHGHAQLLSDQDLVFGLCTWKVDIHRTAWFDSAMFLLNYFLAFAVLWVVTAIHSQNRWLPYLHWQNRKYKKYMYMYKCLEIILTRIFFRTSPLHTSNNFCRPPIFNPSSLRQMKIPLECMIQKVWFLDMQAALSEETAHPTVYLHLSEPWAVYIQLDWLLRWWYTVEWAVSSESVMLK